MATICTQTISGLAKDCATSKGGIKTVYIANYEDVAEVTVTENKVSAITMKDTAKFKQYNFRKGTGSMSSNLTVDAANGVNFVTTDLSLSFLRMETAKRVEMSALAVNDLAIIVEDANSIYWYLGFDEAVTASSGTGETGVARTDGSKYGIVLQDTASTFPYEVDATLIADTIIEFK